MDAQNFDTAYKKVKDLIAKFKQQEKYYLSSSYQEAEVRQDFLDDFFTALGWDVRHNYQHNPYEQEVKIERGVKVSGAQKRADYSFSLAPNFRDPKFFAEAKKPAKALKNAQDYFQSIRYGWHKAHPLSILTDFEEFHILDCRYTPDINNSLDKCYKRFHYTDYLDKEKFREIYWLFSREAVANNSIEKVAETLPKRKGKAAKFILHQTIDEAFLEVIDGIREKLAKAFKKQDENLTSEELTEATQRTVDRLVFIRFLEDKLIEQEHWVSEFGEKGSVWNDFISTCRKLDVKYNGIVFKEHFIDEQNFAGPDESEFRTICQDICHLNSHFLFNEIPIHILGSIYERFLGKVVHATAKRVTVEEKPEVQKAGGVYYTPKYIVDYIVRNTVGKLIEGKTPEQIAKLRFADIACGSGSFLIGVFDCLLDYHNKYYQKHPDKAKKDKCIEKDGLWVLSIKQKQKILLNNIYGVDIDQQATEVTQLSLALKMMEDETTATANEMQVLFHEKILPDMSKNIICGNSLIGTDILTQNLFANDEEQKLNPMNFEDVFKDVMRNGGFDAIVGNPPWGQKAVKFSDIEKEYLKNNYPASTIGIYDLFRFFIEKSISLLNNKGHWGQVLPDIVLLKNYDSTRKLILDKLSIEKIDHWGMAFTGVNIDSCTITGYINNNKKNIITASIHNDNEHVVNKIPQNVFIEIEGYKFNLTLNPEKHSILKQLQKLPKFSDLFNAHEGIHTGNVREKLFVDSKKNKFCKKLILGRDEVQRYFLKWNGGWVDYRKEIIDKNKKEYAGLGRPEYFENEKIVVRRTGDYVLAALDSEGMYFSNNVFVCLPKQNSKLLLTYYLGLLNSNLMTWYYLTIQPRKGKLFSELKINQLNSFPIKVIDNKNSKELELYNKMNNLANQLISAKKEIVNSKTARGKTYYENKIISAQNEINRITYSLYDLDNKTVDIIENELLN